LHGDGLFLFDGYTNGVASVTGAKLNISAIDSSFNPNQYNNASLSYSDISLYEISPPAHSVDGGNYFPVISSTVNSADTSLDGIAISSKVFYGPSITPAPGSTISGPIEATESWDTLANYKLDYLNYSAFTATETLNASLSYSDLYLYRYDSISSTNQATVLGDYGEMSLYLGNSVHSGSTNQAFLSTLGHYGTYFYTSLNDGSTNSTVIGDYNLNDLSLSNFHTNALSTLTASLGCGADVYFHKNDSLTTLTGDYSLNGLSLYQKNSTDVLNASLSYSDVAFSDLRTGLTLAGDYKINGLNVLSKSPSLSSSASLSYSDLNLYQQGATLTLTADYGVSNLKIDQLTSNGELFSSLDANHLVLSGQNKVVNLNIPSATLTGQTLGSALNAGWAEVNLCVNGTPVKAMAFLSDTYN